MLWRNSAKGVGHVELFADADRRWILDFLVPRDGAGALGGGIVIDAVLGAFAKKSAAVCFQMTDQVLTLQPFLLNRQQEGPERIASVNPGCN